jgi:HEAT repeats
MRLRRLAAVGLLLLATSPARADKVDELTQALLTDPSFKVKVQAALVLGKLNDKRAVPALVTALRDSNDTVRGMAALSLGKLGDPRAVGPLREHENDGSEFVRSNVTKALVMISASTGAPPPPVSVPAPAAGARHFVTVKINAQGGGPEAPRLLSEATLQELARLPKVTTAVGSGTPTAAVLASHKLTGWVVEGNLKIKVSGSGSASQLDCDVSASIATFPQRSIKATSTAGASIPGVRSATDSRAQRECFDAVAQGLAEDVGKFLRTQP